MRMRPATIMLCLGLLTACAETPAAPTVADRTSPPTRDRTSPPGQTNVTAVQPSTEPPVSPSPRPTRRGTTIVAATSDFGTILFDATGQAIYLFDVEGTTRPRCYGPCARAWPPVLAKGSPLAGKRIRASLLGTTSRRDGTSQVTYDGRPLYFYAHEGRHEVECHDVFLNGGTWYAVRPDGRRA